MKMASLSVRYLLCSLHCTHPQCVSGYLSSFVICRRRRAVVRWMMGCCCGRQDSSPKELVGKSDPDSDSDEQNERNRKAAVQEEKRQEDSPKKVNEEPKTPVVKKYTRLKPGSERRAPYLVAQYDYKPETRAEISLKIGDVVRLIEDDSEDARKDWVFVTRVDRCGTGYAPRAYLADKETLASNAWFFGPMARKEAENVLTSTSAGTFMVRDQEKTSKKAPHPANHEHTLSMKLKTGEIKHFPIYHLPESYGGGYFLSKLRKFISLDGLVDWYRRSGQEEDVYMVEPAKKIPPKIVPIPVSAQKTWREISRSQILLGKQVGQGNFGVVHEGTWTKPNVTTVRVAVKELRNGSTAAKYQFIKEAVVMKHLNHKNLVKMFGVVSTEEPYWLIQEFVQNGSLHKYLRDKRRPPPEEGGLLSERELVDICLQVACGMHYLEEKKLVHRDLAARNVLVDAGTGNQRLIIKVADFGMAKIIEDDVDPTSARKRVRDIPTKWTAPEALDKGLYSTKSDVWSFGVLTFEVFTFAKEPFAIYLNAFVRRLVVINRQYLRRDTLIPERVYDLMTKCFKYEPADRPTFKEIYDFFNKYFGEPLEKSAEKSNDKMKDQHAPEPSQPASK